MKVGVGSGAGIGFLVLAFTFVIFDWSSLVILAYSTAFVLVGATLLGITVTAVVNVLVELAKR